MLESPKARSPSAPPSLPPLWISRSLLGAPSGPCQGRLSIPVLEQRLPDAGEGRQGRGSHYGSYNNNNKENAIQKV